MSFLRLKHLAASGLFALARLAAATPAEQCALDLNALPGYLLENDAGAPTNFALQGQAHFDVALQRARAAATRIADDDACDTVLSDYLKAWRGGHLLIKSVRPARQSKEPAPAGNASGDQSPGNARARDPRLAVLSAKTLLITLPSFNSGYGQVLTDLLESHRAELESHHDWIIDVRANEGGGDGEYSSLLPWIMQDEWVAQGSEFLSTPANIAAWGQVCALLGNGDPRCAALVDPIEAALRTVASGQFVAPPGSPAHAVRRLAAIEPHRPERVAVLTDKGCASACEQFLLTLRQSFAVKLLGRPSYGALDFSNMLPYRLPSGQRLLFYAGSRSTRLPQSPVDGIGVLPDIVLPAPPDAAGRDREVADVRRWLEGGTLEPERKP